MSARAKTGDPLGRLAGLAEVDRAAMSEPGGYSYSRHWHNHYAGEAADLADGPLAAAYADAVAADEAAKRDPATPEQRGLRLLAKRRAYAAEVGRRRRVEE